MSFSYSIADGRGGVATAQVVLELAPAPDPIPPEAVDDTVGPVRAGREIRVRPAPQRPRPRRFAAHVDRAARRPVDDGAARRPRQSDRTTRDPRASRYRVRDDQGLVSAPAFVTSSSPRTRRRRSRRCAPRRRSPRRSRFDLHTVVTDPDGDPLVITLGTKRSGGSVKVVGTAADDFLQVQFTPDSEFSGPATFDFKVDDRFGHVVAGNAVVDVLRRRTVRRSRRRSRSRPRPALLRSCGFRTR